MSDLSDIVPMLAHGGQVRRGRVSGFVESGAVEVLLQAGVRAVECRVLQSGASSMVLTDGDEVLVWQDGQDAEVRVVLGRIAPYEAGTEARRAAHDASRPQALIFEAQGDIVLRNDRARIKLGADGDVEIVCDAFATRSRRLLRLLAPLIRLN